MSATIEKTYLGNRIEGLDIPSTVDDLTPEFLTTIIADMNPGTVVTAIDYTNVSHFGEINVSTGDRGKLELTYAGPSALPTRVVAKMHRGNDFALTRMYETEVGVYRNFRNDLLLETPRAIASVFDPETSRFCLLLEDLGEKGARFLSADQDVSVEQVDAILDSQAKLHAHYWESPRFAGDMRLFQSHVSGPIHEHFMKRYPGVAEKSVAETPWKAELLAELDRVPATLWSEAVKAQRYQATLPQTIVHGDGHIGNTYVLPDGTGGLLDWQLTVRGAWIHDVNYTIVTGLPPKVARDNEQDLVRRHLDRLKAYGVETPPTFEIAWRAYRMCQAWNLAAWLGTPDISYWTVNKIANQRCAEAYAELETSRVLAEI
ncbi:MAG: phosphotransferase [Sphingobium sp.]